MAREGGALRLVLQKEAPVNFCRPSVDVLFKSAVSELGAGVIGVVLTGIGQDGAEGCREIALAGGRVLVQDEASSVVWGMPGSAVENGSAASILSLEGIAEEIGRLVVPGGDC
jgi:two-component system chemotaxis response regulator CheB